MPDETVQIPARLEPKNGISPYSLGLVSVAHFDRGLEFTYEIECKNIEYKGEVRIRVNRSENIDSTYADAHKSLVNVLRHLLWQADVLAEGGRRTE